MTELVSLLSCLVVLYYLMWQKVSGVWKWHSIDLYDTSIARRSGDENITRCYTAIVFAFCYQLLTQLLEHYDDVIMSTLASQITSLTIVYSTIYSGADQSKHQSSASLAFVWGIHRGPVKSPHIWPVTRKMFPFDDVIMEPIYDDLLFLYLCQVSIYLFLMIY